MLRSTRSRLSPGEDVSTRPIRRSSAAPHRATVRFGLLRDPQRRFVKAPGASPQSGAWGKRSVCDALVLCAWPARGPAAGVVAAPFRSERQGLCRRRVRHSRHFVAERWRLLFFFSWGAGATWAGKRLGGAGGRAPGSYWAGVRRCPPAAFPLALVGGGARWRSAAAAAGGAESPEGLTRLSPQQGRANTAMSGCRVFIGRLNPAAREKDVERFFKGYGRIRDIDLKRGFGFVVSAPPLPSPLPWCSLAFEVYEAPSKENH